jgi:uncharacterized surface protein with fasciclin (FAS1) repeats
MLNKRRPLGRQTSNQEIVMRTFASLALALALTACGDSTSSTPGPTSPATNPQAQSDIVDTAVAAGQFTTLVKAVQAADLAATLKGPGPFTVFAPNDAAFAKLPQGTLDELLKPENKAKLQSILTYHVVAGKVTSGDAAKLTSAKTVQGQELKVGAMDGTVSVDGAKVIKADIECTNGVIHVIDSVVLPK